MLYICLMAESLAAWMLQPAAIDNAGLTRAREILKEQSLLKNL